MGFSDWTPGATQKLLARLVMMSTEVHAHRNKAEAGFLYASSAPDPVSTLQRVHADPYGLEDKRVKRKL